MISMPKIQSIRQLMRVGESVAAISRKTGVSEPTVRKYLRVDDLSVVPDGLRTFGVVSCARFQFASCMVSWSRDMSR